MALLSHVKFEETSGTSLADEVLGAGAWTLLGGVTLNQTGKYGLAAAFNGSSGYIKRDNSVIGNTPAAFTLMAWVKGSATSGAIIAFGLSTNSGPILNVAAAAGGKASFFWRSEAGTIWLNFASTATAFDNEWRHVAVSYSSYVATLYVDGSASGSATVAEASRSLTTTFNRSAVGALLRSSAGAYINSLIDDARIYNTALDAAAIAEAMNDSGASSLLLRRRRMMQCQ